MIRTNTRKFLASTAFCLFTLLLAGCGSVEYGIADSGKSAKPDDSHRLAHGEPHLIHVNLIERVATLRNGEDIEGFLFATDHSGKQSAVLKALPLRSLSSLRTADILEGRPEINDRIRQANEEETASLSKIYRDAHTDNP